VELGQLPGRPRRLHACTTCTPATARTTLQPWPYGPSDGGEDHNNSWDQGGVAADQRKAARNGLALLMLSPACR
jgi:hypothetical protein